MTTRGIVAMIGTFAFVSVISLSAYAQAPAGQAPAPGGAPAAQAPAGGQKAESAKGELKSVDAAKMTLTLASGETFMFNEQTKVTGAQGGVAGLATVVRTTGHDSVHSEGCRPHRHLDRSGRAGK